MDIERQIAMRRPVSYRRYRQYDRPFTILLGLTDIVTWLYFFGIPFLPTTLPHLANFGTFIAFVREGIRHVIK